MNRIKPSVLITICLAIELFLFGVIGYCAQEYHTPLPAGLAVIFVVWWFWVILCLAETQ